MPDGSCLGLDCQDNEFIDPRNDESDSTSEFVTVRSLVDCTYPRKGGGVRQVSGQSTKFVHRNVNILEFTLFTPFSFVLRALLVWYLVSSLQ